MGSKDSEDGLYELDTLVMGQLESDRPTIQVFDPAGVRVALSTLVDERRYEREEILGEGGMGSVYLAADRQIGRRVAMKVVRDELVRNAEAVTRFLREARVQGQLEHPAVVPVYDLATDDTGAAYFTMKRIKGVTLSQVLNALAEGRPGVAERFSQRRLLTDFAKVCLAVDYAHQHGVLHRDLKPDNIMFGHYGEVYVLDWGVAKIMAERVDRVAQATQVRVRDGDVQVTGHSLLGTPAFMAPERLADEPGRHLPGTDVYSLGCILFEVLTWLPANDAESVRSAMRNALRGVEVTPSTRAPDLKVDPELEDILVRSTARQPTARYATARELHDALQRYLDGQKDAELRGDLSRAHARAATAAVKQLDDAEDESTLVRSRAMQEIGRSLALDPENQEAMDAMVNLLNHPPRVLPGEVQRELDHSEREHFIWTGKVAGTAYLSLTLYLPLILWAGVLSAGPLILYYTLAVTASAISFVVGFSERPKMWLVLASGVVSTLCQASTACMFGALVMTPALVTTNAAAYAILLKGWRRWFIAGFGSAVLLALILVEIGSSGGARYVFDAAGMTIRPGAIGLGRLPAISMLTVAAFGNIVTATLSMSRVRDSLLKAETRLHLYAWQIRQLVPTVVGRSSSPGTGRDTLSRR